MTLRDWLKCPIGESSCKAAFSDWCEENGFDKLAAYVREWSIVDGPGWDRRCTKQVVRDKGPRLACWDQKRAEKRLYGLLRGSIEHEIYLQMIGCSKAGA